MNRRVPNGTHGGVEGGLITRPSDSYWEARSDSPYENLPHSLAMAIICQNWQKINSNWRFFARPPTTVQGKQEQ